MAFLAWIIWGLLAGFLISKLFKRTREGIAVDIAFAAAAGLIGAATWFAFGPSGFQLYSILLGGTATVLLIAGYNAIRYKGPAELRARIQAPKTTHSASLRSEPGQMKRSQPSDPAPAQPNPISTWEGEGGSPHPVER